MQSLMPRTVAINMALPVEPHTSEREVRTMNDIFTVQRLRSMKMNAFASEPERQLADNANFSSLGFEERLGLLVDCEWDRRQANKLNRYIHNARFQRATLLLRALNTLRTDTLTKTDNVSPLANTLTMGIISFSRVHRGMERRILPVILAILPAVSSGQ